MQNTIMMLTQKVPRLASPGRTRQLFQRILGLSCLLTLGLVAEAQKAEPKLVPLAMAPAPPRPTDFLAPSFHKQRREQLREQLPPHGVAVLFAAPVRNRANDVSYIYHQDPDFYYLTGYDEPDAVLLLFKEPRTVGGQVGVTEALFTQPRDAAAEQWTGRRLGQAGAKTQLQMQFTADNKDFAGAGIKWADFDQVLFTSLPTDTRDDPKDPADLHSLVATFRQQAGVPADYTTDRTMVYKVLKRYGMTNASDVTAYLTNLVKEYPKMSVDPSVQAYLAATTTAARQKAIDPNPPGRYDGVTLGEALDDLRAVKNPEELALLRRAIRISTAGQREVMKLLRPDMGEMTCRACMNTCTADMALNSRATPAS
jgi:Xaa-Pro aminopeptidase